MSLFLLSNRNKRSHLSKKDHVGIFLVNIKISEALSSPLTRQLVEVEEAVDDQEGNPGLPAPGVF